MAFKNKADATAYQNSYISRAYDRINLTVPKGQKEAIKAHAEARGESVNGFIGRVIKETIERDNVPQSASEADCGGIQPDDLLPPSYHEGQQADRTPELDQNGDIIPGQHS